jgi:hypothetical protein
MLVVLLLFHVAGRVFNVCHADNVELLRMQFNMSLLSTPLAWHYYHKACLSLPAHTGYNSDDDHVATRTQSSFN